MGLLSSIFKRGAAAPAAKPVADSADAVQLLRVRARRRLIGAAVLVGIGVIGFPLIFETQPRPIPVDLPIEIPRKELAVPLQIPAPQVVQVEPKLEPLPAAVAPSAPVLPAVEPVATKPIEKTEKIEKPVSKPVAKAESARVQALLEGKPAEKKASETGGRYIVQVGAYADAKAAQEARMKVEKLGLKTYTQAVETGDGRRIRVRVGPFASREEADKAAAKVRGGGLATAVLTL